MGIAVGWVWTVLSIKVMAQGAWIPGMKGLGIQPQSVVTSCRWPLGVGTSHSHNRHLPPSSISSKPPRTPKHGPSEPLLAVTPLYAQRSQFRGGECAG